MKIKRINSLMAMAVLFVGVGAASAGAVEGGVIAPFPKIRVRKVPFPKI